FAETLLPLLNSDEKKALEMATEKINEFDEKFSQKWWKMMWSKLGIIQPQEGDDLLLNELLKLMEVHQKDYTNTFNFLRLPEILDENKFFLNEKFEPWISKWQQRINQQEGGKATAFEIMKSNNPNLIPRNFHVENALKKAEKGDLSLMKSLLNLTKNPYEYHPEMQEFLYSDDSFDSQFMTFCGT